MSFSIKKQKLDKFLLFTRKIIEEERFIQARNFINKLKKVYEQIPLEHKDIVQLRKLNELNRITNIGLNLKD